MPGLEYSYDENGDYIEVDKQKGANGKDYVLFWGGPYSNWHYQPFDHDGQTYNCSEQFMMAAKARMFNDHETLVEIMQARDPGVQKYLGRQVRDFDPAVWGPAAVDIMVPALVSKFTSTPRLKQLILDSGDAVIVEASPYDKIWGIGLGRDDPDALDETKWRGVNHLGVALMKARDVIKGL